MDPSVPMLTAGAPVSRGATQVLRCPDGTFVSNVPFARIGPFSLTTSQMSDRVRRYGRREAAWTSAKLLGEGDGEPPSHGRD